jgi:hypothetical protein
MIWWKFSLIRLRPDYGGTGDSGTQKNMELCIFSFDAYSGRNMLLSR